MRSNYRVAASLIGILVLAGAGCGGPSAEGDKPSDKSVVETVKKEIRGPGNKDAAMSSSQKQRAIADVAKIANDISGGSAKMTAQMENDLIVKKGINFSFSVSKPLSANQHNAVISAVKKAGYSIIDEEKPGVGGEDDEDFGGVAGERDGVAIYIGYGDGAKEMTFIAMSTEQYAYLESTNTEDESEY